MNLKKYDSLSKRDFDNGAIRDEIREVIEENAKLREALDVHSIDMHEVSSRPCPTCKALSEILGKPYGCYDFQQFRLKEAGDEHKSGA